MHLLYSNFSDYPVWFMSIIKEILQTPVITLKKPSLIFESSQEAANHNKETLRAHRNSLNKYLCSQQDTFISFVAEFGPPTLLGKLLCHHPKLAKIEQNTRAGIRLAGIPYLE
jgi:hypothetical protein